MPTPKTCPLCSAGNSSQTVVTSHVYGDESKSKAFYHCMGCDVFYQYPRLSRKEEVKFYEKEFESFMAGRSGESGGWQNAQKHIEANSATKSRRMKYLQEYLGNVEDILEFGCSSGFMLEHLKKLNKRCYGIEPSGVFHEFIKDNFHVFRSADELKENFPQQKYDLILHFFVLEHINDPIKFLKEQIQMLRPGGRIIFEIPNAADPLFSIYDIPAFERFYWSVAHPWYFTERSLNYVLQATSVNYTVRLDQRYDLSNHFTWALYGKPGGTGTYSDAIGLELDNAYKEGLKKIGKCDTLIAILEVE